MKIKKLTRTSTVCSDGNAQWVAMFQSGNAFMDAILRMTDLFGRGAPYTSYNHIDSGYPWLFRQRETGAQALSYHALYLTSEEQITLLSLSYKEDD